MAWLTNIYEITLSKLYIAPIPCNALLLLALPCPCSAVLFHQRIFQFYYLENLELTFNVTTLPRVCKMRALQDSLCGAHATQTPSNHTILFELLVLFIISLIHFRCAKTTGFTLSYTGFMIRFMNYHAASKNGEILQCYISFNVGVLQSAIIQSLVYLVEFIFHAY